MRVGRSAQAGFTLLELLMVVIIIAILASIALPTYFRTTERARVGQVLTLLESIRGSQIRYAANPTGGNGLYATTAQLPNLDIAPLPAVPVGWGAITTIGAGGPGGGANNAIARTAASGGCVAGSTLQIDIDAGTVCASTAGCGTEWGVAGPGC